MIDPKGDGVPDVDDYRRLQQDGAEFFETAPVAMVQVAADGRILRTNAADLGLLGYPLEEYVGRSIFDFHVDPSVASELLVRVAAREELKGIEARLLHRDGSIREVTIDAAAKWEGDRLLHVTLVSRDVTGERHQERERSRFQEALEQMVATRTEWLARIAEDLRREVDRRAAAERELSRRNLILEHALEGIAALDPAGRCLSVNPALAEMLLADPAAPAGGSWTDWIHPDDRPVAEGARRDAMRFGRAEAEFRILRTPRSVLHVETLLLVARMDGSNDTMYAFLRDITSRKHAQQALEHSERRVRAIVETAHDAILTVDSEGVVTFANGATERLFGWSEAEIVGMPLVRLIPPSRRDAHTSGFARFMATGQTRLQGRIVELPAMHRDGHEFPIELSITSWESGGRRFGTAIIRDVTERRAAEENLRVSEAKYRTLVDSVKEIIGTSSAEGRILSINPAFKAVTGMDPEAWIGKDKTQLVHPDDVPNVKSQFETLLRGLAPPALEIRLKTDRGGWVWVEVSSLPHVREGQVTHVLWVARDISERKRLEEDRARVNAQLLQGQKLQAIGQLAAGVAHEINNPVGYILTNLGVTGEYCDDLDRIVARAEEALQAAISGAGPEVAKRSLEELRAMAASGLLKDFRSALKDCREGAGRIREIVRNLQSFAHVDEVEMQEADLNAGIESTLKICWNELKYKAEVVRDYGELPKVTCHPQRLNQVFMNLLVNAAQAIEKRGEIRITTRAEGDQVVLKFRDSGCGIPPEHRHKIFEPFFTTKKIGKGTGLGLHVVYNIVTAHGGSVQVESEVGRGTEFTVRLPVRPEESKTEEEERKTEKEQERGTGKSQERGTDKPR